MKREVVLIRCDDCGTQSTEMHELTVTVDGHEQGFDACTPGCAVRLVHAFVTEVTERAEMARRRQRLAEAV